MVPIINTVILNENTSLYDAISFIINNNSDKSVYINLDAIVDFIYIKLLLSNTSKLRTKSIRQLGTYDFKGLTRKQIAKNVLIDMTKLDLIIYVYSIEYKVRDELNIKKIQFENDVQIRHYSDRNIIIDVNDYLAIKLSEHITLNLSSSQMKTK